MSTESRAKLFRTRDDDKDSAVTNIELFFDLVFVFAVTQLAHRLLDHLTPLGAVETLVLFLAVWWLWVYTSWVTNWLDPERGLVRSLLIAMMLGVLIMSGALERAFERDGLLFVTAYVAMQVLRTLAIVWASRGVNRDRMRNFIRIIFYFAMAAPLWIAGAFAEPLARLGLWTAALAIEYSGPFLFFRTPGLGRSRIDDWDISGAHMAERCALFIIIALGEAVLVTGATYAKLPHDAATNAAFVASFVGSAAMWWVYFDVGAKRAGAVMGETQEAGRLARNAYTYAHMPIVAGIVVSAVADEMVMAHPHGQASLAFILVACGGPLLFLAGNQLFKTMTSRLPIPPLSHFVGEVLLVGIGVGAWFRGWEPLTIAVLTASALVLTAAWEWFSLHGGWQRWTPWIGRRAAIALEESER